MLPLMLPRMLPFSYLGGCFQEAHAATCLPSCVVGKPHTHVSVPHNAPTVRRQPPPTAAGGPAWPAAAAASEVGPSPSTLACILSSIACTRARSCLQAHRRCRWVGTAHHYAELHCGTAAPPLTTTAITLTHTQPQAHMHCHTRKRTCTAAPPLTTTTTTLMHTQPHARAHAHAHAHAQHLVQGGA